MIHSKKEYTDGVHLRAEFTGEHGYIYNLARLDAIKEVLTRVRGSNLAIILCSMDNEILLKLVNAERTSILNHLHTNRDKDASPEK